MNYMSEVAKMLGVELGEEFECNNGHKYMFTEKGIVSKTIIYAGRFCFKPDQEEEHYKSVLMALLNGELTIVHKLWKPTYGEVFYAVSKDGSVTYGMWDNSLTTINYYKIGNCYKTQSEAEANRDKWIAFYSSDEVLEV